MSKRRNGIREVINLYPKSGKTKHRLQETVLAGLSSEGIPDFILEELSRSLDPVLRRMAAIDRMARIY